MNVLCLQSVEPLQIDSPTELRCRGFARAFAAAGHTFHWCQNFVGNTEEARAYERSLNLERVHVHFLPASRRYHFLCRAEGGIRMFLPRRYWIWGRNHRIYDYLCKTFRRGDIDFVIASAPTFDSLHTAAVLAQRLGVPWCADMRDIPDEHDPKHLRFKTRAEFKRVKRELRGADLVCTVSDGLVERLTQDYERTDAFRVSHGYEGELRPISPPTKSECFTILFAGTVSYGYEHNLEIVLTALDRMLNNGIAPETVEIQLILSHSFVNFKRFATHPSYRCLRLVDKVPRKEVLERERSASVLLSLASYGRRGILTTKIFEYASSFRPVVSVPADHDELDAFITKSRIGTVTDTAEELQAALEQWYNEWRALGQTPNTSPDLEFLQSWSRPVQSAKLVKKVEEFVRNSQSAKHRHDYL